MQLFLFRTINESIIMSTDQIVEEIKEKTHGLMYLSEYEFPIQVFCCDTEENAIQKLFDISGIKQNESLEETSLSFLYKNINTLQGNQHLSEIENTKKYHELLNYLVENLNNIKIYRIGEALVHVFILGALENGKYITLATKSFE